MRPEDRAKRDNVRVKGEAEQT